MTKGRDNLAATFKDILDMVGARRQTGMLSIERLQENRYEEGEVYIQGGRVVYAKVGRLVGQEALIELLQWRQIYFAFLPDAGRPTADVSASAGVTGTTTLPFPVSALTPTRFPTVNRNTSLREGEVRRTTGGLESQPTQIAPQVTETSTPGLEWLTPHKVGGERDVMALPLTRPQRSIYLLIDGRRTVADLSRCTRKSMHEIERLLAELQEHGLVTI